MGSQLRDPINNCARRTVCWHTFRALLVINPLFTTNKSIIPASMPIRAKKPLKSAIVSVISGYWPANLLSAARCVAYSQPFLVRTNYCRM